jgi:pyrroline-5-carboxylate reductase
MRAADASIVLIGYGNMGRALASGWVARGIPAAAITVVDPNTEATEGAAEQGHATASDAAAAASGADVVLLAVKPAELDTVLASLATQRERIGVFLSIAAGKTLSGMQRILGDAAAIVRAMPNTPAAIGQGMTGLCASASVSEAQRALCTELLTAVGRVEWVEDEARMDAITAVSGSGPAYVFLLIECLTAAGCEAGLEAGLARRLATATVAGAGAYAAETDVDAAELRRRVTSPGGTTAAALDVLQDDDAFANLLRRAVRAAAERSRELAAD